MTAPANIATWPMQADYAVRGDWRGLAKYNQKAATGKAAAPKAKAAPPLAAPAASPTTSPSSAASARGSPRSSPRAG